MLLICTKDTTDVPEVSKRRTEILCLPGYALFIAMKSSAFVNNSLDCGQEHLKSSAKDV